MSELPLHIQDQAKAATTQAQGTFAKTVAVMAITGLLEGKVRTIPGERVLELLRQCKPCAHLQNPQQVFVLLGLREMCCTNCLDTAIERLKAQLDQNCDICGEFVADNIFSEFTIQAGSAIVFGNRGHCCDALATD